MYITSCSNELQPRCYTGTSVVAYTFNKRYLLYFSNQYFCVPHLSHRGIFSFLLLFFNLWLISWTTLVHFPEPWILLNFDYFETGSHTAQASVIFPVAEAELRLSWDSWRPCLHLPSSRTTATYDHTCWNLKSSLRYPEWTPSWLAGK